MKTTALKKFVLVVIAYISLIGIGLVFADGQPTTSPYHNPAETGINLDASLIVGAGLYGAGIIMTSASRAIQAKLKIR